MTSFIDGFTWREGFEMMLDAGMSNRQIVEALNLTRGGEVKDSSAMRQAQRYRAGVQGTGRQSRGGTRGPSAPVARALKRLAASRALRKRMFVTAGISVTATSSGKSAGARSLERWPVDPMPDVADLVAAGDDAAAGEQFAEYVAQDYTGGEWLEITDWTSLEIEN